MKKSRKKRLKRAGRLAVSKSWINNYRGKSIVTEYAKTYGVDKICAMLELRMNGIEITEAYENQIKRDVASELNAKQLKKEKRQRELYGDIGDNHFSYIIGYTSGGVPFGLTHWEMEMLKEE